ncbi:MAG TPA: TonB-dependent receptor [Candidatus Acidoferrales bacterium]|nr:TonB-dependent receptor [Candidatus Acidoferrales bacterium]
MEPVQRKPSSGRQIPAVSKRANLAPTLRGFAAAGRCVAALALLAFALGTSARAAGTRVDGAVRDASGASVPGAEVKLIAGSYAAQTATDSSGSFSFEGVPDTSGTITVTAQGFREVEQPWKANEESPARVNFVLEPLPLNQQVIVTAARTETPVGETPVSDIQLSRDDLRATPALTLDDMLRQVPGFSLFRRTSSRTANPTTLGVSLRGLGANGASRALVLEDGIPLNDPFGSWVYWDRIPSASVSSVEIAQEGASSLYGSEALGGVVQFLTRPAHPGGISLETAYGNQNTKDVSLSAGGQLGRWEAAFAGEAFHTDGYFLVPGTSLGSVDTRALSQHGTADLTIGRRIGERSEVFARGWYFDDSRNNGTVGQTNGIRLGEGALGANLDMGTAGTLQLRSYGDFQSYHQAFYSVQLNQNTEALTDQQRVPAQGIGGSALWSRGLGERQTLVAGFDEHEELGHSNESIFSATTGNHLRDTAAGGHQRTAGVFGEDLIQVAPRWTLGLSARFDDWRNFDAFQVTNPVTPPGPTTTTLFASRSYTAFSPRASLVHQINSHVSWSASVYRAFRAPTLNELYRSFRQANNLTVSNANLRAERMTGGEAGVAVQGINGRLQFRGTFFFNEIINPISSISCQVTPVPPICPPPTANTFTFVRSNLGRTSAPGVELDWIARVTDRFQLSGGYQYVDAMVISAPGQTSLLNTWVAQVPHNEFTFQARYTNPSLISLSVEGRMVGMQFDTNQLPMGNFFVLDLMASRNLTHGVEFFTAVENLFNEQYVSTAATSLSPAQIGLPIAARCGIRFDFPSKR